MKKRIKIFIISFSLIAFSFSAAQSENDTLYIASWNMENLFDAIDDPDKRDEEFLPDGKKEWTNEKIDLKIKNQARVIEWMNNGRGPDLLGIQEVEHQHLIDTLLQRYFPNKNYKVAYKETPDKRGIDNGLIYNGDKFELIDINPIEVELPSKYPTRYILEVHLKNINGEEVYVFVNHWPSRSGGEERSKPNRIKAASVLRDVIDILYKKNDKLNIVIIGDFNDNPNNVSIARYLWTHPYTCSTKAEPMRLYNLSYSEFISGNGTYLYRGNWNMLDQIIVSNEIVEDGRIKYICNSFELIKPDFMITQSGKYKGAATPTFGGRKYIAGFSDHIPVGAKFIFVQ
ncbi:MAG: endonuclease/exonuclease/phosphatase family protein [Melioribacteraceae bacterium]|nr:endonuclease/exonuclease/phosphatase family protein [Melioribacteraceae bacterium]